MDVLFSAITPPCTRKLRRRHFKNSDQCRRIEQLGHWIEMIKIILRHRLWFGPYTSRSRGMHGAEAWLHRIGGSWSDSGLKFFDESAVYLALILIFYVLEVP
jgi:hypothetical protein